jgi:hypothetical protein
MTVVAVLQPGYLPWLGFFDQILRSDVFVYYDDVQFDKHGWRNRNRIKTPAGPLWLTVPVLNVGRSGQKLNQVEIDNRRPWARKHLASIAQSYSRAPYLRRYLPELENMLLQRWDRLADLDMAVAALMCDWLAIERRIERSSVLSVSGGRSERLLGICKRLAGDCYLTGDSAKDYLDVDLFLRNEVRVEWQTYRHPTYRQMHGSFIPYLSTLDLLLNTGPESRGLLEGIA